MLFRTMLLIALALGAISNSPVSAQTDCGTQNVNAGYGTFVTYEICCSNPRQYNYTPPLVLTFDHGTASMGQNWIIEYDADNMFPFNTSNNPDDWGFDYPHYGTMSYDNGDDITYTGPCRFWIELTYVSSFGGTPCTYQGTPRDLFIAKFKVQSCTSGHTLTNRFIAVATSHCVVLGTGCPQNWLTATISGF